jgi:HlyD family secretion protein
MSSRRPGWMAVIVLMLAVALIPAAYFYGRNQHRAPEQSRYRTEPVSRGDIVQTVSANGTLNPVVLVDVGTQISGRIQTLYADFNDRVTAGQVLAELDPRLIEARLNQKRAALVKTEADLRLAESDLKRTRGLVNRKFISDAELEKAERTVDVARADVAQARAEVNLEETNLKYTIIHSPVSGVVVSRDVAVGQTVAASFQTPTLFKVAEDLTKMQIDTSLAEADVGNVRVGQSASFTVDAYPDRTFTGVVRQIRLNPTVQQNVVTYNVVIAVENPEQLFLPGMTAVVNIVTATRDQVLRVPAAALRFRPPESAKVEGAEAVTAGRRVYQAQSEALKALAVRTGISDGKFAELLGDTLKEGDALVVEDTSLRAGGGPPAGGFRFRAF